MLQNIILDFTRNRPLMRIFLQNGSVYLIRRNRSSRQTDKTQSRSRDHILVEPFTAKESRSNSPSPHSVTPIAPDHDAGKLYPASSPVNLIFLSPQVYVIMSHLAIISSKTPIRRDATLLTSASIFPSFTPIMRNFSRKPQHYGERSDF